MMRRERRQPTKAELARITSNKPLVRRIPPYPGPNEHAHQDVTRILELSEQGFSPETIASSVALSELFILEVLERASQVTDSYKVGEAGEA
jgi:hypothetical protein